MKTIIFWNIRVVYKTGGSPLFSQTFTEHIMFSSSDQARVVYGVEVDSDGDNYYHDIVDNKEKNIFRINLEI